MTGAMEFTTFQELLATIAERVLRRLGAGYTVVVVMPDSPAYIEQPHRMPFVLCIDTPSAIRMLDEITGNESLHAQLEASLVDGTNATVVVTESRAAACFTERKEPAS